jgi:hypothetical protein
MTVGVDLVGLGPPLQTTSLEVTSVMGYQSVSVSTWMRWNNETYTIVFRDSDTITHRTTVQREEDSVCGC